ncbi:ABC transporter permease [Pseudomonas tolaasii]|uniref:ABC transporter permease n=2 Tax=Pseudomonas tolaasii TaxID=29442 RepID=A0A7Y8AMW6_PSETO|nr:ABC transporter permease subunit [Pseudomonas tolaasii]ARB25927.1 sulfate ABC transporter permease [Pseudomonas tolaasii]KAB0466962.1 ABC transporter permease [Pseudomonas tolaasii]MBW1249642.1 ABC transporter permease [Pseudomonas tolaasii]MBW4793541.1 ABC transporter permease [Pseudomonas tolaasii]MBY8939223.1 ABC transporter permease [Pseudomonas tolaasii]
MSRALWLGVPATVLLAIPFAALIGATSWAHLHLAYGDGAAVGVSLGLSSVSTVLIVLLGTPPALWLARSRSAWRRAVEALLLVSLLTPPLAMGILLVTAYGPYATLGEALGHLGVTLNNNWPAFVLAQLYGGLAYYILCARTAFESVPRSVEDAARGLGCSPVQVFLRVTLPVTRRALASALAIVWVRVIGEFGIVMVFAYFPQGIPVKLFVNLQNEGVDSVYALLWLLLLVTLPFPLWCLSVRKRQGLSAVRAGWS